MMNRCAWAAVAVILTAAPVSAQQMAAGSGVNPKALSTVFVEDEQGTETTGQLLSVDKRSILVLVDGQERRFELEKIRRVQKRGDSIRNGAVIGALIGAVMGGLTGGMSDCRQPDGGFGPCGAGARIAATLVSAGMFSAIGAGIDAAIQGRSTIYQKPATSAGFAARGPAPSLRVSLRW